MTAIKQTSISGNCVKHELKKIALPLIPSKYSTSGNTNVESLTSSSGNNKLIISLTSYPARIPYVQTVLESIVQLDVDKNLYHIVFVLSEPEFPNKEKDLPNELVEFIKKNDVELIWYYRNIRSHKKLMPTLAKYPNNPILIVDDDVTRPEGWLQMFINDNKMYPHDIICGATKLWLCKKFYWEKYSNVAISTKAGRINGIPKVILNTGRPMNGFGGTLYPAGTFTDKRFFDEDKMMELSPSSDESWQWCFNIIENRIIRLSSIIYDYSKNIINGSQESALCKENDKKYTNILSVLCKAFPELSVLLHKRLEPSTHKFAIVTIVNDDFMPGIKTMLYSFYRYNNWFNGDLIILTNDKYSKLSDTHKKELQKMFKNVIFKEIPSEKYDKIDLKYIPTKFIAPLIKFEIFGLDEYEKVLYLDSDLLIVNNIKQLFYTKDKLIMCTHERYVVLQPECWNDIYDNTINTNINNGMILISKEYLDKKHVDNLLKLIYTYNREFPGYRGCPDLDIMQYYFIHNNIQVTLFSNNYNTIKRVFANTAKKLTTEKIIHYIMKKPWNSSEPEFKYINSVWWSYYNKIKNYK